MTGPVPAILASDPCPCGSKLSYANCCGPIHEGLPAETAEQLMRSRYSAFALGLTAHLLRTWHPSTRPPELELELDDIEWRRLQIVDTVRGLADDRDGVVEFRARFRGPDGSGLMHERSRFERSDGDWLYVDGVQL